MQTPRQRVEAALLGQLADHVPFTMDFNEFFLCPEERELRNGGMCVVEQRVPVYLERNPDVVEQTIQYRGADGVIASEEDSSHAQRRDRPRCTRCGPTMCGFRAS